ncbi:MAG TPA: c-type cytochrome [Candidatus Acidoferrales bacterium]|nr:c-type cytochrome [Candidatus Acidoferrales bacterium]
MNSDRLLWAVALGLVSFLVGAPPGVMAQLGPPVAPPHKPHPPTTPESVAKGKDLFQGTCANCHGIDGSGANGPNIQNAAQTMGPERLYTTIAAGVIGSGMPSFASLGEDTLWEIVDYVSSLGHHGEGMVVGDPQRGKQTYAANGCAKCHTISGVGGDSGPDLTTIGAQRAASVLRDEVLDPGANLPLDTAGLSERAAYHAYEMYRVTLKDGKQVEGMRVDEDSFSIQLRDQKGEIHSIEKLSAEKVEELPGKSFMPSFQGKLSDAELNDLVAYLASLGGGQ